MKLSGASYDELYGNFRWEVPARFNIAHAICDRHAAATPDAPALIHEAADGSVNVWTFARIRESADRLAHALAALGVGRGAIVAIHLSQCPENLITHVAVHKLGAVAMPLFALFGPDAVRFRLEDSGAAVFVTADDNMERVAAGLIDIPTLHHIISIDGPGPLGVKGFWELAASASSSSVATDTSPDDPAYLMYTSGTTGEPKGVMHTSNTILSNVRPFRERLGLTGQDVVLMSSPLAHQSGFIYGLLMPVVLQTTVVLQDVWEPRQAAELIAADRATFTFASTPFLSDLTDAVGRGGCDVSSLRIFLAAGAPIPRVLVERASKTLGATIVSAWGMTENGAVTTTKPGDPDEKAFFTDGCALPGMEVGVFGPDAEPLPPGEEGVLKVRGCSDFVGYLKRPQLYNHDAGGWFDTGDLARIDADGYVRITGRAKDIIIRGGENIQVVEIEGLLFRHPAVQAVAIVGMHDARLVERACAFVVPKQGQQLSFEHMAQFLSDQKVARQYLPERLEVVAELPLTPSGKVQKFRLREIANTLDA